MAERQSVCKKVYVLKNGDEVRNVASGSHLAADVDRLEFRFSNDSVHVIRVADFEEDIALAATWHGLSQGLGDKFAGASGDADAAEEGFLTKLELYKEGSWITARVAGEARPSLIIEAVVAALIERGDEVDDARRASIADKLSPRNSEGKVDREAAAQERKKTLANPKINAHYERIKLERQAEKQKKAAEAAAAAPDASLDDF